MTTKKRSKERKIPAYIRLPESLHDEVMKLAEVNDRSMQKELVALIRQGLEKSR